MPLKPVDFGILIIALGITAGSFFSAYSNRNSRPGINIKGQNGAWVFPPDAVETVTVPGPLGDTVVAIGGGTARVLSSPCANQTCVAAAAIHSRGQWTACLPNKVMLYIDGSAGAESPAARTYEEGVDAAAW